MIPDGSARLAALKRGEVDITYSLQGEIAEELQRTPNFKLKAPIVNGTFCLYFPDQWDAKSPGHDVRVRQAGDPNQGHQSSASSGLCPKHRQHCAGELRLQGEQQQRVAIAWALSPSRPFSNGVVRRVGLRLDFRSCLLCAVGGMSHTHLW